MKKLLILFVLFLVISNPAEGAFSIATGNYTGDGNDNRSISGVGFQPDFITLFADNTTDSVYSTSNFTSGDSIEYEGLAGFLTNIIQAFESDGFQVGTDTQANEDTTKYYYVAIKYDASDSNSINYTGDGNDNRSLTGVGFQGTAMWICGTGTNFPILMTEPNSSDNSGPFDGSFGYAANRIQAFESDGFQIGTANAVNENTFIFQTVSFIDVTNGFETGTYTGNATGSRDIEVGFLPEFVLVNRGDAASANPSAFMTTDIDTDASGGGTVESGAFATGHIIGFHSSGFTIGTFGSVNSSGGTYNWMAWKSPLTTTTRRVFLTQYSQDELYNSRRN